MKKVFGILFVAILVCSLVVVWPVAATSEELVSKPGEYSGYSEVLYDGWQRFSEYVEVSLYFDAPDGTPLENPTKLAVDIFRPTLNGEVVETPHPVLFCFTPYKRATNTSYQAGASYADYFTKYGYVVAVADARGTGASYGYRKAQNDRVEAQDNHDVIEWLGIQPWCDGNVGMWGASYTGQTVLAAITTMPPHLKAGVAGCTDFNGYDDKGRGGLLRGPSFATEPPWTSHLNTLPVDGDIDTNGDGYPDMLYEACWEHQYNTLQYPFLSSIPFRDSWANETDSMYWIECATSEYLDEIETSGVPLYIWGGVYDLMRRGTMMMYANWPNPKKMVFGPWTHAGSSPDFNRTVDIHRFYDYWLKDIDNGVMDEPPIYYATVVNAPEDQEWGFAWQWPVPNANESITYFLEEGPSGTAPSVNDGVLSTSTPTGVGEKDDYTTVYGITTNIDPYWFPLPTGTELDQKGLTYTTAPLTEDITVIGHAMATLWVSSTATDSAFWVVLEDVDPNGVSKYVTDGRLRVSLRSTTTPPYDFLGLPWHRCYQEDTQLLVPGEIVELEIDIMPTSYVFKEGHRIRLVLACSMGGYFVDFPQFDPPPIVSIYRDAILSSRITLPIVTGPIAPSVQIAPDTLYLGSQGVFTAYVTPEETLPSGYRVEDIDISTVECNGAPAVRGTVQDGTLVVHFNRQDLVDVPTGEEVTLTVKGEFYYGIPFAGSDTIRVMEES